MELYISGTAKQEKQEVVWDGVCRFRALDCAKVKMKKNECKTKVAQK